MNKGYRIIMQLSIVAAMTLIVSCENCLARTEIAEDTTQEQFIDAMKDRAEGNYYDAIAKLSTILANKPQLHRARLELAATYRRLFEYSKARELAQQVLDDPNTPPNVRVAVQAFIVQLEHDAKELPSPSRHTWKPEVGLGLMYDTNVNAGPSAGSFIIEGLEYTLNANSNPSSDSAAILAAGLTHQYRTDKVFPICQKSATLFWQDYLNYNRRDYSNEHAFDQDVLTVGTGPVLASMLNWRANLSAQLDYIRLGNEDLARFISLLPAFTKQFANNAWEVTVDGTISNRDYLKVADQDRDSNYYSGQLSVGYSFDKLKVTVQAGVSELKEIADKNYYSYDGSSVYGAIAWRPWRTGTFFGRVSERTLDYDGKEPFFNISRHDRARQQTIGLTQSFKNSNRLLNDLTLNVYFVRTDNYSNVTTDTYSREQTTLILNKPF